MSKLSVIEKFGSAVEKFGDSIALQDGDLRCSYRELDRLATAFGRRLPGPAATDGQPQPCRVALLVDHGRDAIIGILGILKAAKSYVPLDPTYPFERLSYILKDCRLDALVTDSANLELAYKAIHTAGIDIAVINIDQEAEEEEEQTLTPSASYSEEACVLYTSGSSGRPKGVVVSQASVSEFTTWFADQLTIAAGDRLLLTTSCSHAVAVLDIFGSLLSGATLVMYDVRKEFRKEAFLNYLRSAGVTILHTVPAFFRFIAAGNDSLFGRVRLVLLGGESILRQDFDLYRQFFPDSSYFVNLYGQTELLLGTMNILTKESVIEGNTISIGYPVDLVEAYIFSEDGNKAGVMKTGQIVFQRKEPGGEVLQADSFDAGAEVLVRTGDLGRWLPDGTIEYRGRMDWQFKIQGNRVHASEVELAMEETGAAEKAVVVLRELNGENILAAYYIPGKGERLGSEQIRQRLKTRLPAYMLPSAFVLLEQLPLLPNGKIDRFNLPAPEAAGTGPVAEEIPSDITDKLIAIWKEVLSTSTVTDQDNFFHLGGNSLHATEVISRIYMAFHIELELSAIFDNQTIRELSAVLMESLYKPVLQ